MSKSISGQDFISMAVDKNISDALRGATASEKGYFASNLKQRYAVIERENNKTLGRLREKLAARNKK